MYGGAKGDVRIFIKLANEANSPMQNTAVDSDAVLGRIVPIRYKVHDLRAGRTLRVRPPTNLP